MARRPYGYPRYPNMQQQTQVSSVPYISMRDPNAYEDYSKILEGAQQRYDTSQSAIARYLDEYSNAKVSDRNAPALDEIVEGRLGELKETIKDKYDGQYGNAANEIIQRLASARKPVMQAQQAYELEQQAKKEYQAALNSGNAPRDIVRDENGNYVERTLSFEDYYKLPESDFLEGKFAMPEFRALRGRGKHDEWVQKNISSPIMSMIKEGDLKQMEGIFGGLAESIKTRGMSDADVDAYIDNTPELVDSFMANSTFAQEEFNGDRELAKDYLKDLVKAQTVLSTEKGQTGIPGYNPNPVEPSPTPGSNALVFESRLGANQDAYTTDTFYDNSPNARNRIISKQANSPLVGESITVQDLTEGRATYEQYRTNFIEKTIRNNVPELKTLWDIGSKTDDDLAKEVGYSSYSALKTAKQNEAKSESGQSIMSTSDNPFAKASAASWAKKETSNSISQFDKFDKLKKERNDAANKYSETLQNNAEKFIKDFGLDADFNVSLYQPNLMNMEEKTATKYNYWKKNIEEDYSVPGQFRFLDGDLKGETSSDINKEYTNKNGSRKPFSISGVGNLGGEELIWNVRNPDGTFSMAVWDTGYKKKRSYLEFLGEPELLETLNASAISISEDGKLKPTMPDTPILENNIQKYKITAEASPVDPSTQKLKTSKGYIKVRIREDGKKVMSFTKNSDEATFMPKALMFDVINGLPTE